MEMRQEEEKLMSFSHSVQHLQVVMAVTVRHPSPWSCGSVRKLNKNKNKNKIN
jgi:hypothetical protein